MRGGEVEMHAIHALGRRVSQMNKKIYQLDLRSLAHVASVVRRLSEG